MLYGIDLAKAAIAKAGRAVVVEGYTDVLALHQAGIEEAVGVMGTAITERAGGDALGDGRGGGAGARRRLGRAGGDAAGAAGRRRAQDAAAGRGDAGGRGPGRDDGRARAAPSASAALVDGAVELTAFQVGLVLDRTDVASPAERDRALDRGGAGPGRDGRGGEPRRPGAPGGGAARPRAGDGDGPGGRRAPPASGGPRRGAGPRRAARRRRRAPRRARRADLARAPRAGAAGDVHRPAGGGQGVPRAAHRGPPLADRRCAPPPGCASIPRTRPRTCPATTTSSPA